MRYIVVNVAGESASVVRITPAYGGREFTGLTEDEVIQWVIERNIEVGVIPAASAYWVIAEEDLPGGAVSRENDYFFGAWECVDGVVHVDMPKARLIHLDAIRQVRDAKLAALDMPYMRAIEAGDTAAQSAIAAAKQALRDIPHTIDLEQYTTPEALRAAWPAWPA